VKKVVINGVKQVVIEVNGAIVKILTEGETGTSDGVSYSLDSDVHNIWVEIDDSVQSYNYMSISDIWTKVKTAVKNLGDKISSKTKDFIETNKPKIVEALKNVQTVIIAEGKKLIIEINGSIVKVITDALTTTSEDKPVSKRSISDIWTKVKDAVKNMSAAVKDTVQRVVDEHKDKIINALNNVKKVVINGVKQVVIEVNGAIVKILTEGETGTSDGVSYSLDSEVRNIWVEIDDSVQSYNYMSISDIWKKVKSAASNVSAKVKDATLSVIEEYKPKIIDALKNSMRVVIDGITKVVIEVNGTIVKILTDGEVGVSS